MNIVEQILSYFENGEWKLGQSKIDELLSQPYDEEKYSLAEQLHQLGFLEEATTLLNNLIESYPEEGELKLALAEVHIDLGQSDQAILLIEDITKDDPTYGPALFTLADLYMNEGLFEVSHQKLDEARFVLPDEESVVDLAKAELFFVEGKYQNAIYYYNQLLVANVDLEVNIHHRMAEALSAIGKFEEALPHYEKAIQEHLDIDTLFGYGLTAYQAGLYQQAIKSFEELLGLDPEYHSVYLYLAKSYESEERLSESFNTVKKGIKYDEFNKELYFYGGKIALKNGSEEEAEQYLRESIAIDPGYVEAGLTLNKLFIKQERYDDVLEIIDVMENSGEEDPQFHWDRAIALQHTEKYSDALNEYLRAYNDFKNDRDFLQDYGYFLVEEGKQKEAAEIFNQLLIEDPTNTEWLEIVERLSDQGW